MLRDLGALYQKARGEASFFFLFVCFFSCLLLHTDNTGWDWRVLPECNKCRETVRAPETEEPNLKAPSGQSSNKLSSEIIDK